MKHSEKILDETILQRWSRRKHAAEEESDSNELENSQALNIETDLEGPALTDADMPSIESLDEDSDYSGFLSPEVSEELRKLALQKLFHMPTFNMRDGLDDYDSDYTEFAKLGSLVTADMKHMLEVEAKQKLEQLATLDSDTEIEQAMDVKADENELVLTDSAGVDEEISGDSEIDQLELNET